MIANLKPHIALFGRKADPKWVNGISSLIDALSKRGVRICYYAGFLDLLESLKCPNLPDGDIFTSHRNLPSDISLLISLGGDGTFLSSLAIVRERELPVAGINFGRLGFLTTVKASQGAEEWIDALLNGKFETQKRSLLKISSDLVPEGFYQYALNEIAIQRESPYMIGVDIKINGETIPTYWSDGLLVATPTGSTAYSLSVGGPVVVPDSNVFVMAPIAPHNLNIRPLIIPDSSHLEVVIHSKNSGAIVSVDNRSFKIPAESTIHINKGEFTMNLVSLFSSGFFTALQDKLLWGADKRNNL